MYNFLRTIFFFFKVQVYFDTLSAKKLDKLFLSDKLTSLHKLHVQLESGMLMLQNKSKSLQTWQQTSIL